MEISKSFSYGTIPTWKTWECWESVQLSKSDTRKEFIEFVDCNTHPNERSADSSGPTAYFVLKHTLCWSSPPFKHWRARLYLTTKNICKGRLWVSSIGFNVSWVRRKSLRDHPITGLKPFVRNLSSSRGLLWWLCSRAIKPVSSSDGWNGLWAHTWRYYVIDILLCRKSGRKHPFCGNKAGCGWFDSFKARHTKPDLQTTPVLHSHYLIDKLIAPIKKLLMILLAS